MRRSISAAAGLVLLLVSSGAGHEGHDHHSVLGTVEKLEKEQIVVKDREGRSVLVRLSPQTELHGKDGGATRDVLAVGDRVVVTVAGKGADASADRIRFSHPGKSDGK